MGGRGTVVLPDHFHAIFSLPERDADYPCGCG